MANFRLQGSKIGRRCAHRECTRPFMPLPWGQTLTIFAYAMVSCLVVNDAVKVAMIKWRVPTAAA